MTPTAKPATKTQRVDELIHTMGFAARNPPTGWHAQVRQQLKSEGIEVNDSLMYKRQKLLAGGGKKPDGRKARGKARAGDNPLAQVMNGRQDTNGLAQPRPIAGVTLLSDIKGEHLVKIAELAQALGGWGQLKAAVEMLEKILQTDGL